MGHTRNSTQMQHQLWKINNSKLKIRRRIDQVIRELKRLESVPTSQPWRSFQRVNSIQELKSQFPSLKKALQKDLILLRSQIRDLSRRAMNVRLGAAERSSRDFNKELDKILRGAENRGYLTESEMGDLRDTAESVLKPYVDILNVAPTEKNMQRVLKKLEAPLLLGSSVDGTICGEAFRALARASEKLAVQKEKNFRNNPTVENFATLLNSIATSQAVGGNAEIEKIGWSPANTTHPVQPGDTLSSISLKYYGDIKYWDIIYFENWGIIGNDVKKLPTNITLTIP